MCSPTFDAPITGFRSCFLILSMSLISASYWTRTVVFSFVVVGVLIWVESAALADAAAEAAAEAAKVRRAEQLRKLLKTVREAQDLSTASNAYARARSLDSRNPETYAAYMRKALTLGQPRQPGLCSKWRVITGHCR